MALVATPLKPSTTNIEGGIAGIVATMGVGFLAHAGYLAIAAATIGVPEATMSVVAMGVIGALANVAVTHIAELKEADGFVKAVQSIKTYPEYPEDAAMKGAMFKAPPPDGE